MPLATVVNDLHSDDALLWLLTFRDYTSGLVLRAVNNLEEVTSRTFRYQPFPFELTLPPDDGDRFQTLSLTFPNAGRELMQLIRKYAPDQPPLVKIELVLANSLDTVEKTIDFLTMTNASYDALAVTITLAPANIFQRKTCQATYNSTEFPGLFFALR